MKGKWQKLIMILTGNTVLACAISFFIAPGNLVMGGSAGLAFVLQPLLHLPLATLVAIINLIFFLLGLVVLGWQFAALTLMSSLLFPMMIRILGPVASLQTMTINPWLASIIGGLLTGLGVGLVLLSGASMGGMTVVPVILQRYCRIQPAKTLLAFDLMILLGRSLLSAAGTEIMQGVIIIGLTSLTIYLLQGSQRRDRSARHLVQQESGLSG